MANWLASNQLGLTKFPFNLQHLRLFSVSTIRTAMLNTWTPNWFIICFVLEPIKWQIWDIQYFHVPFCSPDLPEANHKRCINQLRNFWCQPGFFRFSGHGSRRGSETVHGNTEKLARIWLHFVWRGGTEFAFWSRVEGKWSRVEGRG